MDSGTVSPAPWWTLADVGSASVGVAERDALGTSARLAVWPAGSLTAALRAVDAELAVLDETASRFRADSEITAVHQRGGGAHLISGELAEAIAVALAAAEWTGGLVDPTVGAALISLGYDRDFAAIPAWAPEPPQRQPVPGWRAVELAGCVLRVPEGIRLDLGATAKALGSDRAARAAARCVPGGGALVSLGGDIAVAGEPPVGGWPVLVADEPEPGGARPPARDGSSPGAAPQTVRLARGAVATSSIVCRQWRRGGQRLHHIIDPRTGLPAAGPWRTVSVAAASCAEANAAATAAVIAGDSAPEWLEFHGLPARLTGRDSEIRLVGGWPPADGGLLPVPAAPRMPAFQAAGVDFGPAGAGPLALPTAAHWPGA